MNWIQIRNTSTSSPWNEYWVGVDWVELHLSLPTSGVDTGDGDIRHPARPAALTLLPPNPNPMPRTARLEFGLPTDGVVRLAIYDVSGREVRRLLDGPQNAGWHSLTWDGNGAPGARLSPGVYFARLSEPDARWCSA